MHTKVFENNFNGKPMFSVYEVDENGERVCKFDPNTGQPVEPKPLVNMGFKKANLAMKHSRELADFVTDKEQR